MKEQFLHNLAAVLNALNNISVSGKANLGNLSGSINLLEQMYDALSQVEITTGDMPAQAGAAEEQQ